MKRYLGLLLTIPFILLAAIPGSAARPNLKFQVTFNGHPVTFDVQPEVVEPGHTMVPFRALFEKMGTTVAFDDASKVVTATRGSTSVKFTIGSSTASVNGSEKSLPLAPYIKDGRTLIPLRFVSETMGAEVKFDAATTRISIVDSNWPKRGGDLNLALWNKPSGEFNPIIEDETYQQELGSKIWDGLWRYDERVMPIPALAEGWEWDDSQTRLTFYLRHDVKFHDGTPLTAKDVVFTYKAIFHPKYTGPRNEGWSDLLGYEDYTKGVKGETKADFDAGIVSATPIDGLYAVDDYTVIFKLKQVNPVFLERLAYGILDSSKYATVPVQNWGQAADPNNKKPNGSGPFKLESMAEGQNYVMTANPDYFHGRPYIDRIIYRVLSSDLSIGEMQRGTLDKVEFNATEYNEYKALNDTNLVEYPTMSLQYMGFNTVSGPTSDKRVRQAISYAIDRQTIIHDLMNDHASALYTPIHPLTWAFTPDVEQYTFSTQKAGQLLDDAGWKMGSDGIRAKEGKKLTLRLVYPNVGNHVRIRTAPVVQQMLKPIGVDVKLEGYDFATVVDKAFTTYEHDMYFIGMSLSINPDPSSIFGKEAANTPGSFNGTRWWTDKSEDLLHRALATTDIDERIELYTQWQKLFAEEAPAFLFYAPTTLTATSRRLQNFKPGVQGDLWNIEELWLSN